MKKRSFAVSLVGGLAIGFLGFGLAAALVFFGIRPSIERGTRGLDSYREGDVRVWYTSKSGGVIDPESVRAETEALMVETAEWIHVDPRELPLPIEVFLHQDMNELVSSVVNRDSDYRSLNWTTLDRLPWEDPRVRVSELVLAYGWGECTSQILYAGMALYAAYPDRDFHTFVAALPEQARHSMSELISLESSGSFPQTFYQAYASPFVMRFGISLAATKRHFDIPKFFSHIPEKHQLYLESASLVQYLIEDLSSMDAVRAAWEVGFSANILPGLTGLSPDELTLRWHEAALRDGLGASDYPVQHVRLLIESGDCEEVFEITESWSAIDTTPERLELMIVSSVLVGEFDRAMTLIDQAQGTDEPVDPGVLQWTRDLVEGSTITTGSVRIISASSTSPSDPELLRIRETADALGEMLGALDTEPLGLATVVVYADPQQWEQATKITSSFGIPSTLTEVVEGEDIPLAMARVLLLCMLGETRSKLLERGSALMVSSDRSELITEAARLQREGKWQPFGTLSYMGRDAGDADVQSACLVQAILDEFGSSKFREIWRSTSTLGDGYCLDTALRTCVGITREELEDLILAVEPSLP